MNITGAKVVARYLDGRLVKGLTYDFQVGRSRLHIFPTTTPSRAVAVSMADLKAVFFVRDLVGNPRYNERRTFPEGSSCPVTGARVAVAFGDGEVLVGTVETGSHTSGGLVLVPADPGSNNLRVYVVSSAIQSVRALPAAPPARRAAPRAIPRATHRDTRSRARWLPAPILAWLSRPVPG